MKERQKVFSGRTGPNTCAIDTAVDHILAVASEKEPGTSFTVAAASLPELNPHRKQIIADKLTLRGVSIESMDGETYIFRKRHPRPRA